MSGHGKSKKKFIGGLVMTVIFGIVLAAIFMPLFDGHNGLNYLDNLYNSISKGSAYYIPGLKERSKEFDGKNVKVTMAMASQAEAANAALLYQAAGAQAEAKGKMLLVSGDLGKILASALKDSDSMYHNDGNALTVRYHGKNPRVMLYTWWSSLKALEKDLNRQKAFAQAKFIVTVKKRAVEMTYNFYQIQPDSIGDRWGIVLFSLLFYVFYTLWYGFGVMYMFEGAGYSLEH